MAPNDLITAHSSREKSLSPEETANWLSQATFWYVGQLLKLANKKSNSDQEGLNQEDLWELLRDDETQPLSEEFRRLWATHYKPATDAGKSPFVATLWAQFGRRMVWAGAVKLVNDLLQIGTPFAVLQLLQFLEDGGPDSEGYIWASVVFGLSSAKAVVENYYFKSVFRVGMRIQSVVITMVFQKALLLSQVARQSASTGEIVNYMQLDGRRLMDFCQFFHVIWSGLVQILGYSTMLCFVLSPASSFAGIGAMLMFMPLQVKLQGRLAMIRKGVNKATDKRVKLTNEVLQGMKAIKMMGWQVPFTEAMKPIRDAEMYHLVRLSYIQAINMALFGAIPAVVAVMAFLVYTLAEDKTLTPAKAFTALLLFSQLRMPLMFYPMSLIQWVGARESVRRLDAFASLDEIQSLQFAGQSQPSGPAAAAAAPASPAAAPPPGPAPAQESPRVSIQQGKFLWGTQAVEKSKKEKDAKAAGSGAGGGKGGDSKGGAQGESKGAVGAAGGANASEPSGEAAAAGTDASDGGEAAVDEPESACLVDIDFEAANGQLVAIVGRVGSGKSAMIAAMLGELKREQGTVEVRGTVAYAAQTPWILNQSLRDNIVFGKPFDADRYNRIVKVCGLEHDIELLPAGNDTEIGEKGINLSGGQKARVSLARAVYSDSDIVVLDDPLSALDAQVGHEVFEQCIMGELRHKVRILVTNQLWCLDRCDNIYSLGPDQRIAQAGTYDALMADGGGAFNAMMKEFGAADTAAEAATESKEAKEATAGRASRDGRGSEVPPAAAKDGDQKGGAGAAGGVGAAAPGGELIVAEDRKRGAVQRNIYMRYVTAARSPMLLVWALFVLLMQNLLEKGHQWWVTYWTDTLSDDREDCATARLLRVQANASATSLIGECVAGAKGCVEVEGDGWQWVGEVDCEESHPLSFYLSVYAAIAVVQCFFALARYLSVAVFARRTSSRLHNALFANILRAPMGWFDTIPIGRIINRFSQDINEMDEKTPEVLNMFLFMSLHCVVIVLMMVYILPFFGLLLLPVLLLYFHFVRYFRNLAREGKRLVAQSASPVFATFSEVLGGLPTVRAYRCEEPLFGKISGLVDEAHRAYWAIRLGDRWLSTRLETLGNLMVAGNAYLIVASGSISTGYAGLSTMLCMSAISMFNFIIRQFAELEACMASVERILTFSHEIPQELDTKGEAAGVEKTAQEQVPSAKSTAAVPSDWPARGDIVISNLTMRYRPELELVLVEPGLSLHLPAGQNVGVCGRTGSGKSSLLLVLLRIVEPAGGTIAIDGLDISQVPLNTLRNRISIIPQEPVMFSGTLRFNLDPFSEYSEVQVWEALRRVGLEEQVKEVGGLDKEGGVSEYGENWSQGQRQMLCLCRALLKDARVLLMDEATASVDFETDQQMQRVIRSEFKAASVLTVAHRINTIIDSDKVLVLRDGTIAEFDTPAALLDGMRYPEGAFAALVDETGASSSSQLRAQAAAADMSMAPEGAGVDGVTTLQELA